MLYDDGARPRDSASHRRRRGAPGRLEPPRRASSGAAAAAEARTPSRRRSSPATPSRRRQHDGAAVGSTSTAAIAERGLREHRTHRLISTQVDIRGKKIPTKVAKMPFVEPNYWRVPE